MFSKLCIRKPVTTIMVTLMVFIAGIVSYFNLDQAVIQTRSRKREIVQARQITMYLAKKYTDCSFSHIGKIVGKKDHATVLHACKTIKDQMETSKSFRSSVEEIEVKLRS